MEKKSTNVDIGTTAQSDANNVLAKKWKTRIDEYDCNNCTNGIVRVEVKEKFGQGQVSVKKCDYCNHQYYIKQLQELKAHCH